MTNHEDQMPLPAVAAVGSLRAPFDAVRKVSSGRRQPVGGTPPYSYSSSPAGIVAVDGTGLVVARAVGKTQVTARDSATPFAATASYEVNVTSPAPVIVAPIPIWLPPYETSINASTLPTGMVMVQQIPPYPGYAAGHMACLDTMYVAFSDGVERVVASDERVFMKPGGNDCSIDGAALKQTQKNLGNCRMTSRVRLYFSASTPAGTPDMFGEWSAQSLLLSY